MGAASVALVTGAGGGLGAAIARALAGRGHDLVLNDLEPSERLEALAAELRALGVRVEIMAQDIAQVAQLPGYVAGVAARMGRLDVLVNNAAEQHPVDDITELPESQLERTFRTNVYGYFFMTKAALPHLKEGAAIVNTTSVTAYRGSEQLLDYSATRGAVLALTRSLSQALVDRGIRVNGVAPGPIWTPLIPASFDAEKVASFGKKQPMGRPGQPNEVASCHLFLACDDSSYMTGQVLHPNGGEAVGG